MSAILDGRAQPRVRPFVSVHGRAADIPPHPPEDAVNSKLKLNLDELSVDSFDTSVGERPRGTVFGEQCTCYTQCTCPGCPTCDASCNGTCGGTCGENTCAASCNGTCGAATCGYSCNYTDCDCLPPTCQQTNCGMDLCCGIG
jgi:hypothetical protein